MDKYRYDGSIMVYNKWAGHYSFETVAKSEADARKNFLFQAKKKLNWTPSAGGVSLAGKITKID